nr:unnamed protein product [Digitaria exilis]
MQSQFAVFSPAVARTWCGARALARHPNLRALAEQLLRAEEEEERQSRRRDDSMAMHPGAGASSASSAPCNDERSSRPLRQPTPPLSAAASPTDLPVPVPLFPVSGGSTPSWTLTPPSFQDHIDTTTHHTTNTKLAR